MVRIGAIALVGVLSFMPLAASPALAADTPAFVNASMCDVAAPLAAGTTVFRRQIRADRPLRIADRAPVGKRAEARPQPLLTPRQAPVKASAEPASESEAVLRLAVHFCVTPAGVANPIRYT